MLLVVLASRGRSVRDVLEEHVLAGDVLELEVGEEVMGAVRHRVVEEDAIRHYEEGHGLRARGEWTVI